MLVVKGDCTMLIHVNVDKDVYEILSQKAEELQRSVGQYCSELLTIWCRQELEPKDVKSTAALEEEIISLKAELLELAQEGTKENYQPDLTTEDVDKVKEKVEPKTKNPFDEEDDTD